ncbi:MAG: sensor histidine kinase [Peptococcaceae bacterium]|nr:sensor histidine kinase [Peptococcaceae bacterium]
MTWMVYLKEHWLFLAFQGILLFIFCLMLSMLHQSWEIYFLLIGTIIILTFAALFADYFPRKKYYSEIFEALETTDQKRLILELIDRPDFLDGYIFYDMLRIITKSVNDQFSIYDAERKEYQQYIETWVHEIKTPIAAAELICKNHSAPWTQQMQTELGRINWYVDQSLYYARIGTVEKSTIIHAEWLDEIVRQAVKAHANQLIALKCTPKFYKLDIKVFTDKKWMIFVLSQLIGNSIQYHRTPMELIFSAQEFSDQVVLSVSDNGIGIPSYDLPRIFDRGFTGDNGRKYGKSTGMGLYLCETFCRKLNHKIIVESTLQNGTCFKIFFPKNKLTLFEE